jgi:hypothetical protein
LVKMPDGATEIKLPPTDKVIILWKILNGPKVKFKQDNTGITLTVDTTQLDPTVTTFALATKK